MLRRRALATVMIMILLICNSVQTNTKVKASQPVSKELTLGEVYYDSLESKDVQKWYQFTTTQAGYFSLSFLKDTNEKKEWDIKLYDSDRDLIKSLSTTESKEISTGEYGYDAGTYYIQVYSPYPVLYYSDSQYGLKVSFEPTEYWEKEKQNDSLDIINTVELNKEYTGNLYTQKDVDCYKFQISEPGYFNIQFDKISDNMSQWNFEIYDSNRDLIQAYVTSEKNKMTTKNYGFNKGTYYLKVYSRYPALYYDDSNYTFKINFKKSSTWETEYNDTRTKADKLTLKKTKTAYSASISGLLHNKQDVDYYKVILSKKGNFTVTFKHDYIEGARWRISICKKDGTVLAYMDNDKTSTKLVKTLNKGTYYLKVECKYPALYYSNGEYKLTGTLK